MNFKAKHLKWKLQFELATADDSDTRHGITEVLGFRAKPQHPSTVAFDFPNIVTYHRPRFFVVHA